MVNTRGGMLAKYKRTWLALALPFLWLPMIVGALQTPPSEPDGAELHWPHSTAEWLMLPRSVDTWLQARFGFRETLLDVNARLRFALRSPTTDRVVFGRDGWLFLSDDAVFQQSMGLRMRVPLVTQGARGGARYRRTAEQPEHQSRGGAGLGAGGGGADGI
jgi:hypothetical protein